MNAIASTRVQTAKNLRDNHIALVIPAYQRPYVWPSEDVTKLLEDIVAAYMAGEPHYYIGTILTAILPPKDKSSKTETHELIDGQQRMTTLMLLALAFAKYVPGVDLADVVVIGEETRLTFAIREQVQGLLGHWAGLEPENTPSHDAISHNPYLSNLNAGLIAAEQCLAGLRASDDAKRCDLVAIGGYLFTQVKWVNNVMPDGMDLNKLFATMNTSGVQLEQSDILKSRLLHKITINKARYDAIWQACENMGNYFERNVRQLFPEADWQNLEYEQLARFSKEHFPLAENSSQHSDEVSINDIAAMDIVSLKDGVKDDFENEGRCRSIISFSLFLMHAYRIYRFRQSQNDFDVRLKDSRLNESFSDFVDSATEQQAIKFLEHLWSVRYQYDRWVVKWVKREEDDEDYLRLTSVHRNQSNKRYRLNRSPRERSNLSQLQSVRNFTGERSAQYWLTPFLGRLISVNYQKSDDVSALLEDIDNQLSLTEDTQKIASFALLSGNLINVQAFNDVEDYLRSAKGTGFQHYWFQKLEYVLWRERESMSYFESRNLEAYRITSKNSIEHVHPQNEEHGKKLNPNPKFLHAFGNLVLLSPGENSAYSNQDVGKKEIDFKRKSTYDSLKLAHMFHVKSDGEWSSDTIIEHENNMIEILNTHYQVAYPY